MGLLIPNWLKKFRKEGMKGSNKMIQDSTRKIYRRKFKMTNQILVVIQMNILPQAVDFKNNNHLLQNFHKVGIHLNWSLSR